jgi:DNA-binding MurR/RpiR family transcriptional regulator
MAVAERIDVQRARLTPAERRVAEVVLSRPQAVAFGTVSELAATAGASGATVVRLASKLGYDGFVGLQAQVRDELDDRLRPAAERIRRRPPTDLLGRSLDTELGNVHQTLEAVDQKAFEGALALLVDRQRAVGVLSGEATRGVALLLADGLGMLRPGVVALGGSEVAVTRAMALLERGDTVVVLDLRRYERWVVASVRQARASGLHIIAVTDSVLSPIAEAADHSFTVTADSTGPFDSHVGTLALLNALVAGAAARLRQSATRRLDRVESAWRDTGALVDS